MIHLCTIAYADHEYLERLVNSAMMSSEVTELYLHDCSPYDAVHQRCQELSDRWSRVHWTNYGFNRGCSACWNDSIIRASRGQLKPLIVNDDVWFSPGDIEQILEVAINSQEAFMVSCAGHHVGFGHPVPSHGYSCFMLNEVAIHQIGAFDENIRPAYLEDSDYSYRAKLLGLNEANAPKTMVYHVGSAAIKSDANLAIANALTHQRNFIYYRQKWGGINGEEVYDKPFNASELSAKIQFANRHAPYGEGRDRGDKADHQAVRLSGM